MRALTAAVSAGDLQNILDHHPFLVEYLFTVEHVEHGSVTVVVPFQEKYVRPGGVIPGFVYMVAADVTMWLAIFTVLGHKADLSVTTDMRSAFLGALAGEDFVCEARVLDTGERLLYGTAACRSRTGALMSHHALTYIMPPEKRV